MTSITPVTLESPAGRRAGDRRTARVLTFADGQSRHMTATVRQWTGFDYLLSGGWSLQEALSVPFKTAKRFHETGEAPDFEAELRSCFKSFIGFAWVYHPDKKKQRPPLIR